MKKPIYKLIDESGRVLIPNELRKKADMETGDIVKLSVSGGRLSVVKVDIVEVGSQDPAMVESFVNAAVKSMGREKQVTLARKILQMAEQEGGREC